MIKTETKKGIKETTRYYDGAPEVKVHVRPCLYSPTELTMNVPNQTFNKHALRAFVADLQEVLDFMEGNS
jgi:hypothetical protein